MTRQRLLWALAILGCVWLVRFNVRGLAGTPPLGLPETFIFPGNDLVVYLKAGLAVAVRHSPYPDAAWHDPAVFHYSPATAGLLAVVTGSNPADVPFRALAFLHLGVILLALPLAWLVWRAVFVEMGLEGGSEAMLVSAPLWIVYSQWFADQNYLNTYTLLLLLDGLLALALLRGRVLVAAFLAVLIAQSKPHYLYPLVLPLFMEDWRLFLKVVGWTIVGYGLGVAATLLALGPRFGLQLYRDYAVFLTTIAERYPWSAFYLGYNHSWQSILHWLFGIRAWVPPMVQALRIATILPLLWSMRRWWLVRRFPPSLPVAALGLAFAGHLWAVISLDQLWELTSTIVVFAFLMAAGSPQVRRLAAAISVPFGLLGVAQLVGWRLASWLDLAPDRLDVTARLPVIMAVALGMYALTVCVVWTRSEPGTLTNLDQTGPRTVKRSGGFC